jgi:hypothetical protein
MRKDSRLPPVVSRTKKPASLPATSHVCAVKPPELSCSSLSAGVSERRWCIFRTGVVVPKPTLPVLSTYTVPVAAPASTVNGTFAPVVSSMEKRLRPPLALSFATSVQAFDGNGSTLVSANSMRVLFSFRRMVEKPKDSALVQSSPTQRLPCTETSSGCVKYFGTGVAFAPFPPCRADGSTLSPGTILPAWTRKAPDTTTRCASAARSNPARSPRSAAGLAGTFEP